ncbi:MAG: YggT family protein [Sulfurimonas sp.]|nr:YggT family protein [Sulfurimonas sp.]
MNIISEIIQGIGFLALGLIEVYVWVIIIAALLSFVKPDPYNPVVQFLYKITNPAYILIRRHVKTNIGGLDLAPLIVIIALQILIVVLKSLLHNM